MIAQKNKNLLGLCAASLLLTGISCSTSVLAQTTTLRNWSQWYPFDRGQAFGERVTSSWISSAFVHPRGAGQNEKIGGQSTWRFPFNDKVPGAPAGHTQPPFAGQDSNRPNTAMPQLFEIPGKVKQHLINYTMNWWCPTDRLFNINSSTNNCPMTDYSEIQSEAPDSAGNPSRYLATWGWGTSTNFLSLHDDLDCPLNTPIADMINLPQHREPLLWGLPETAIGVAKFRSESVCGIRLNLTQMQVLTDPQTGNQFFNYLGNPTRERMFVVIHANQPFVDNAGNQVIEAVNGYYMEKDLANPGYSKSGAKCMADLPVYAAGMKLQESNASQIFPHIPYDACVTMVEQYYMRKVSPSYPLRNGFVGWALHTAGASFGLDWNHKWANNANQFVRDNCQYVNGRPQNCKVN